MRNEQGRRQFAAGVVQTHSLGKSITEVLFARRRDRLPLPSSRGMEVDGVALCRVTLPRLATIEWLRSITLSVVAGFAAGAGTAVQGGALAGAWFR